MRTTIAAALAAALAAAPAAALALPRVGQAPPPFSIPSPDGKPLSLAQYKGKAVYINFFANWCPPCNAEAPDVARLAKKYAGKGFAVIGVDELESSAKAAEFQKKYALPYRVGSDDGGSVGRDYFGGVGLPVHVFVNRAGIVSTYTIGEMHGAEIEAAIRTALK